MKIISAIVLLSMFFIVGPSPSTAQTPEKAKKKPVGIASIIKDTAREAMDDELLPPPPPPPEMTGQGFSIKPVDTTGQWKRDDVEPQFYEFPDTSASPEDELTFEIRKLLKTTAVVEIGLREAGGKLNALRAENDGQLPDEFFDLLEKEFNSDLTKRMFENVTIRVYRKYFDIEDIRALAQFYQSETGKKTLQFLPAIFNESMSNGSSIGSMLGIKVFEQLEKEGKIK